uniref:Uncharacterized protein n=1 Tax=Arundo donax TaxID=35708 RepID=A0A0A9ARL2_ARUDO
MYWSVNEYNIRIAKSVVIVRTASILGFSAFFRIDDSHGVQPSNFWD